MNLDIQGRCERYDAWPSREADQRAVEQARANVAAAWADVQRSLNALRATVSEDGRRDG